MQSTETPRIVGKHYGENENKKLYIQPVPYALNGAGYFYRRAKDDKYK